MARITRQSYSVLTLIKPLAPMQAVFLYSIEADTHSSCFRNLRQLVYRAQTTGFEKYPQMKIPRNQHYHFFSYLGSVYAVRLL